MFNKGIVIINEQHSLLDDQLKVLEKTCSGTWEKLLVPSTGWTANEIDEICCNLLNKVAYEGVDMIIFASPIPLLLKELCIAIHFNFDLTEQPCISVFFNEKREKKEVNGKIISVIAKTGWQLR